MNCNCSLSSEAVPIFLSEQARDWSIQASSMKEKYKSAYISRETNNMVLYSFRVVQVDFRKMFRKTRPTIWKKTSPIALTRSARKTYPSAFQNIKKYESPSSGRDILIFVWAIFENFRKSPDFRHTFPRFWAKSCPNWSKLSIQLKWEVWLFVSTF